jgi:hypothetical protein
MKVEKLTLNYVISRPRPMLSYRQIQLYQFRQFSAALIACEVIANDKVGSCHYVLNESGEEYYRGPPMSKSRQSNKEAKKELAMTPLEKRATKKKYQTLFGNALTAIKSRRTSEQASVCS